MKASQKRPVVRTAWSGEVYGQVAWRERRMGRLGRTDGSENTAYLADVENLFRRDTTMKFAVSPRAPITIVITYKPSFQDRK